MAGPSREQALSLLAAANNHGDLYVKLSSLKQAKDILLSVEPSLAAELFPYLVELQSSPEFLVRKALIEVIEEIGLVAMEHSSVLVPVLLTFLQDSVSTVARQSIITGTKLFCGVLEELTVQFQRHGRVGRWLEELWSWMIKYKDTVFGILFEDGSVGSKLLAMKFLETCVLLFTSDANASEKSCGEAITRSGRVFNISWLVGGHPILDPVVLMSEANRCVGILLDFLQSASNLPGSVKISAVNCLAAIARKRPVYYSSVLSALLKFDPNAETVKGVHTASIQFSLRTALLGFLRCTYPAILDSRDQLLRALRAMNAGDAADQVIRQVDKMIKNNERASRDAQIVKDEQPSHQRVSGDLVKKRSILLDNEEPNGYDVSSKRIRYNSNTHTTPAVNLTDYGLDQSENGVSFKVPLLDSDLSPVEKMIAMIGIFLTEGDKGAKSLEVLLSNIQPDLLADIVITNMKHLPKESPSLTRLGSVPVGQENVSSSDPIAVVAPTSSTAPVQYPIVSGPILFTSANATFSDNNHPTESKRDPRRDPRRLDPRRLTVSVAVPSTPPTEDSTNNMLPGAAQSEFDISSSLNKSVMLPTVTGSENYPVPSTSTAEADLQILERPLTSEPDQHFSKEEVLDKEAQEVAPFLEVDADLDMAHFSASKVEDDTMTPKSSDVIVADEAYSPSLEESDELPPAVSGTGSSEEGCPDLPLLPLYVELTEGQQRNEIKLVFERIIKSYKHLHGGVCKQACMALLSRLLVQIDADDSVVVMMQKHIVSDYQNQKGHEFVMHVLYHLHALVVSDSSEQSSIVSATYDKFLLGMAKLLLDTLPATDKCFSRLLSEVPFLPDSALQLLDDLCYSVNYGGKEFHEGDHVMQGLGTLWSLILGRPLNRKACLDIALKCAVHPQDDIRAKAVRLVANKLYVVDSISEDVEQFATSMMLSVVQGCASDTELSQSGSIEQRTEREIESQEASISDSQISEARAYDDDSGKVTRSDARSESLVSFAQAQCSISLYFALCAKKPSLLQLVFDNYAHAPKAVKQAVHRHIPVLIRALGSSYSELLQIISNLPQGCENLLTQVLHILSEGTTPSTDLIATVKHLYDTKLKDATILIPILSSFSKSEVLPIFPRLVDLPLDKFQMALAHILQGSAHTGPALTPAEVLVAIHDISPERNDIALRKITDVCSACFEQRTVFTQQVLAKALNQMVDQTPLPLLFMRTVIQAIDAFPNLIDFVMEILSKLVSKQVWRMPKLWVGFLKCISQTQPHSYNVLLQLPPAPLENALNKYSTLRGPLAAYVKRSSVKLSLPRSTLVLLGLANELHKSQPNAASSLHTSDTSSSVHGATLT